MRLQNKKENNRCLIVTAVLWVALILMTTVVFSEETAGPLETSPGFQTRECPDNFFDSSQMDDNASGAQVIVVDDTSPEDQSFCSSDGVDWFKFYALAGNQYRIEVTCLSEFCDIVLELYGVNGENLIDQADQVQEDGTQILEFLPTQDGVYYLRVFSSRSMDLGESLQYDLKITTAATAGGQVLGLIEGVVTDIFSGDPIQGALVKTKGDWGAAITVHTGEYKMYHPTGVFTLTAEASGYEIFEETITILEGGTLIENIPMIPNGTLVAGGKDQPDQVKIIVNTDTVFRLIYEAKRAVREEFAEKKCSLFILLRVKGEPFLEPYVFARPNDQYIASQLNNEKYLEIFSINDPGFRNLYYERGIFDENSKDQDFILSGLSGLKDLKVFLETRIYFEETRQFHTVQTVELDMR